MNGKPQPVLWPSPSTPSFPLTPLTDLTTSFFLSLLSAIFFSCHLFFHHFFFLLSLCAFFCAFLFIFVALRIFFKDFTFTQVFILLEVSWNFICLRNEFYERHSLASRDTHEYHFESKYSWFTPSKNQRIQRQAEICLKKWLKKLSKLLTTEFGISGICCTSKKKRRSISKHIRENSAPIRDPRAAIR